MPGRPRPSLGRLAVVLAVAALPALTACSGPDLLDGRGRPVAPGAAASAAASTSVSASPPAPAVATASPSVGPSRSGATSPGGSTSATVPSRELLDSLRRVAASSWPRLSDARTGVDFALPAVVAPQTRITHGVSQRIYSYELAKQSAVSVGFVRTLSPAAAQALLPTYATQLRRSFQSLGVDDATVTESRVTSVGGRPARSFRFTFTPTSIPQVPPAWLVTVVASGADLVLLQTVVFPMTTDYDFLTPARAVQQQLVLSVVLP